MELTKHQNEKMKELVTGSKDRIRMLNGEAGTGKSMCISALLDRLISKFGKSNIAVVAFSSDAVESLQEIVEDKITVQTASSHFGFGGDNGYEKRRSGFYYKPPSALIVDEVSTLPNYLMDEIKSNKIQAFLFGDKFQLKAVSDAPNLEGIYTVSLEEQLRQNTDTTLYRYISELRRAVINEDMSKFIDSNDSSLILTNNKNEFDSMIEEEKGSYWFVAYNRETVSKQKSGIKSTIHKSQGQSVDTIYVDMRDLHKDYVDDDTRRRLLYVAISRAKKKAVLLNYE